MQAAYDEVKEENESLREKLKSAQARIRELESGQTKTDKPVKAKAKPTTDNSTSDGELKWDGEGVYSAWVGYGATDSTKGAYYNICQPLTMAFGGGGSVKQSKKWSVSLSHNSLRYCHFSKDAPTAEKAKELAQQDWARRGQPKENLKWNDREAKATTVGMYLIGDPPLYHGKKQKGCVVSFKPNGGAVQHVGHFRTPSKAREFAQIDWQLRG